MILKTSKLNGRGHYHLCYFGPESASCSENNGHRHEIEMGFDEVSGEPIPVMLPMDGHTHEFVGEPDRKDREKRKDDIELAQEVREFFKQAKSTEEEAVELAKKAEKFIGGEQWSKKNKEQMKAKKRPTLTLDLICPAMDALSGYQRQNRSDVKMFPSENGDARAADMFTEVLKNINHQNNYEYEETDVFDDQSQYGRGLFESYIDYDDNIQGDIVIECRAWDTCYFGPHNRKDLKDCEYLVKHKWYSMDKIKQLWHDKADEIAKDYEFSVAEGLDHNQVKGEQYEQSENQIGLPPDPDFVDTLKKEYRVVELEKKRYVRVPVIVQADDDFTFNGSGWSKKDIASIKTIDGISIVYRKIDKLDVTVVAGSVVLETFVVDDGVFSITPAYAKKNKNMFKGKVAPAMDPQKIVNKGESQKIDILNKVAAYGWGYDNRTFATPKDEKEFKDNSSSPGFVAKLTDATKPPHQFEGVKMPTEIVEMIEASKRNLREVLNVSPNLLGMGDAQQSGIAMIEAKKTGLLSNEFLFDNLNLAKKLLFTRVIGLIQQAYTPERIIRILGASNSKKPVMIAGKPMDEYPVEELQAILDNEQITKYDLVVGESAFSPTQLTNNYVMLLESAKAGAAVPPNMLIENSPMPQDMKDKAMASLSAAQEADSKGEQMKYMTELMKTLGSKLPESVAMEIFEMMMRHLQGDQGQGGQPQQGPPQGPPQP